MDIKIKIPVKVSVKVSETQPEREERGFLLRNKKEKPKPEFYVSDEYGNFFCGYKYGLPYWSNKITEARELTEERHFNSLIRWEKAFRKLKKEFL